MKLELHLDQEADGSFTAVLNGANNAGGIVSARSPSNPNALEAALRVIELYARVHSLPGLAPESLSSEVHAALTKARWSLSSVRTSSGEAQPAPANA